MSLPLLLAWPRASVAVGPAPAAAGTLTDAKATEPASSRDAVLRRARQHFEDGRKAFDAKDYPAALKEFRAGYELEPRPGFLLNMAHATQKIGDLSGARELYTRFLQTNPTGEERRVAEEAISEIDRKSSNAPGPSEGVAPGLGGAQIDGPGSGTTPPSPGGPTVQPLPSGAGPASKPPSTTSGSPSLPDVGAPPSTTTVVSTPGATPSASDQPSEGSPLYTKWWLWTGIGVVAVGVAAFLVFGNKSSDSRDTGTWGQIKL